MSPRRRGRGRHAGGNGPATGVNGPAGQACAVLPSAQDAATNAGAALADRASTFGAEESLNGFAHVNGNRPDGGNPGSGGPVGQRRQPRGRHIGAAPAQAPVAAPPELDQDGVPVPERRPNCTLAQMRRFIKSRPYVPVHELRRRFEIEGIEDEVSPVATEHGTIYVGLPPEQAQFLGELIRSGDVGCEMLLDPASPGVVGVFPMRPVARL